MSFGLRVKVAEYKKGLDEARPADLMRWKEQTVGPGSLDVRPDKFALLSFWGR